MWNRPLAFSAILLAAASAACDQDKSALVGPTDAKYAAMDSTFSSNTNRTFAQVERLGNPLFAEALLQKREHSTHDAFGPDRDPAHFTDDAAHFLMEVAGRDADYAGAVAPALLGTPTMDPGDKLRVFPGRVGSVTAATAGDAANVGFLTYVVAPNNTGYGGRKLMNDDVVDKYLGVAFGTLLGAPATAPGLATDNVPSNDVQARNTFPYFPAAHQ